MSKKRIHNIFIDDMGLIERAGRAGNEYPFCSPAVQRYIEKFFNKLYEGEYAEFMEAPIIYNMADVIYDGIIFVVEQTNKLEFKIAKQLKD